MESLFGADEPNEISYKLAQRIAFFLAENSADARSVFEKVKSCYTMRSKMRRGLKLDDCSS